MAGACVNTQNIETVMPSRVYKLALRSAGVQAHSPRLLAESANLVLRRRLCKAPSPTSRPLPLPPR